MTARGRETGRAARSATWRQRIFASGFSAIGATKADCWLRPFAQGEGVILMFHHVRPWRDRPFAPNRSLEITPAFLAATLRMLRQQGFDIVALDKVPDRLASPGRRNPFAVLTFDDGYRDNLEFAWPVLRDFDVPWTLFVVDDFAAGCGRLWWLELEALIAGREHIAIEFDGMPYVFRTETAEEKHIAFHAILHQLRSGRDPGIREQITTLASRAGIVPDRLVQDLCADWDEIARLAEDPKVTIGSHTLSHPILAQNADDTAACEIACSKTAIERRLGMEVRHIAFPHGDRQAADEREFSLSAASGYATGVTTRPGHVFRRHAENLTALPRVSINGLHQNETALRALLSGVPFLALEIPGLGPRLS